MSSCKTRPSEKIIANDEEHVDYLFDSLADYVNDCISDEIEPGEVAECNEVAMQFPDADFIIEYLIERLAEEDFIPEDWDYIDVKNHLCGIREFKDELNALIKKFNSKQDYNIYQSNGSYLLPEVYMKEFEK